MAIGKSILTFLASLALLIAPTGPAAAAPPAPPSPAGPRLYVLDGGAMANHSPEFFGVTREEVSTTMMADMCFLIVHPKGTLLFDTGLSDKLLGTPVYENLHEESTWLKFRSLIGQLTELGYPPAKIDYLVLSHGSIDHAGNANAFAGSTWLTTRPEWERMFNTPPGERMRGYENFSELRKAKTVFVDDGHDIFGDGSVLIRHAFGHSPGHMILQVNLKNSGPVLLVGDLYHYPEELALGKMSDRERAKKPSVEQSREKVKALARKLGGAPLWASHDMTVYSKVRKPPAFHD